MNDTDKIIIRHPMKDTDPKTLESVIGQALAEKVDREVMALLPKTCKTCKHWNADNKNNSEYRGVGVRVCECGKITEPMNLNGSALDAMIYSYDESGWFWTGPEFGCVHHEEV